MQGATEVLGGETDHPSRPVNKADKGIHHRRDEQRKTSYQEGHRGKPEKFSTAMERAPREPCREEKTGGAPHSPVAGFMRERVAL